DDLHHHRKAHVAGDLGRFGRRLRQPLFGDRDAIGIADQLTFGSGQTVPLVRLDLIENFADGFFGTGHWFPPAAPLWHLVYQKRNCQDKLLLENSEKAGSLDNLASGMPKTFVEDT